ncbi:MAG: rhomboid family intramembrane serine protease [Acidimicrobiales bacterium]|nr:rhomboid family intramembrane serine protease [Acidimicrobiales bacterium]
MFPIADVNPTRRTPIVTVLIMIACIGAWFGWQQEPQRSAGEDFVFNIEHAAIPCELVQGRPLDVQEFNAAFDPTTGGDADSCGIGRDGAPPVVADKMVWLAAVASMFFHGGWLHIGGNLLYLWIFGNNIEDHLGPLRYLAFYLIGGLVATATHVALQPDSVIPVIGASGAVAAVMGAYAVWFPRAPVRTVLLLGFPILVTIKARWVLGFWFVLQFLTSPNSGVAWAAHVGGFVFGAAIGLLIRASGALRHAIWRSEYSGQMDRRWDPTGGVGDVHEYRRWTPGR